MSNVEKCIHCNERPTNFKFLLLCWECWADKQTVANLERDLAAVVL